MALSEVGGRGIRIGQLHGSVFETESDGKACPLVAGVGGTVISAEAVESMTMARAPNLSESLPLGMEPKAQAMLVTVDISPSSRVVNLYVSVRAP